MNEFSKSEQAYQAIKSGIIDGRYSAGYRLVLAQLAEELDISAVPVREAIRRLEAEGYVVFTRNKGAQVADVDPHEYAETMEVLAHLEGAATALSAPNLSAQQIARARAINTEMADSIAEFDPAQFTRLNLEFHRLVNCECTNTHLVELLDREQERLTMVRRNTYSFVPSRATDSVREHEEILKLIEAGAPAVEIELAARDHKLHTLEQFIARMSGTERKKATA